MLRFALLLLGCASCLPDEPAGVPEPVATGAFDGYEVISPCAAAEGTVGVIGRGSVEVVGENAIIEQGRALFSSVGDIAAVWGGGGFGVGCVEGYATRLYLDDRRYLHVVVDRAGAFVRQQDLALQVLIVVDQAPAER